jgi:hypothetical protein
MLVDGLWRVIALADASGTVQTQYVFDPFGTTTTSGAVSSNTVQFNGRENDATGLYDYRARYYKPKLQRLSVKILLGWRMPPVLFRPPTHFDHLVNRRCSALQQRTQLCSLGGKSMVPA